MYFVNIPFIKFHKNNNFVFYLINHITLRINDRRAMFLIVFINFKSQFWNLISIVFNNAVCYFC